MCTDLFKFQIKLQVMTSQTVACMKSGTDSHSNITHLRVSMTLEGNVAQCCISLPFDMAVPFLASLSSGGKQRSRGEYLSEESTFQDESFQFRERERLA